MVEGRLEVVRVVDPRRDEDEWRHRQALLERLLDDARVRRVVLDRIGQEFDPEADVPRLVAVHRGEALDEAGEPLALLQRLDHEPRRREREHPLDHDHVHRDAAHQRWEIAGVLAQPLGRLVQDAVEHRLPVVVHHRAVLFELLTDSAHRRAEHLAVEAIPEDHVLGLVGDLGREEELGLLLRRRQGEGEKLDGDPVLGDEELGEAEGQEPALLLGEHVRIGPLAGVLGEIEVLSRPVLPLPAREQLLVARRGFDDAVEA